VSARVLIACIGNVFLGDDGFGIEVARQLSRSALPSGAEVIDFGVRGLHLVYRLLEPVDLVVIVDAVSRGGIPGTLSLIEPELGRDDDPPCAAEGHGMSLPSVFAAVRAMGGALPRVLLVGCEPAVLEERMELSAPVAVAVDRAVELLQRIVERACGADTTDWKEAVP
jgi:hydrogenase maturation protease